MVGKWFVLTLACERYGSAGAAEPRETRDFASFFAVNEEQTVSHRVAHRLVQRGISKKATVIERIVRGCFAELGK
jgi:hypothetical protein